MAEVASNIADINFITSDNPRNENPKTIISQISKYMKGYYRAEPDRNKAIEKAIKYAKKDDMILIAGKGHETYQEIKGVRYPFSDQTCAKKALKVYKAKWMELTLNQLRKIVAGKYYGDASLLKKTIKNISINSNAIKKNDLFIGIKGEKFNGDDFAKSAIKNGALAAVISCDIKELENKIT